MSTTQISCTISASDPAAGLGVEVWLDNTQLYNTEQFNYESLPMIWGVDNSDGNHELRFVLKNKTEQHTICNNAGEIIKDATITISNVAFEGIELNQILIDNSTYNHDYNGHSEITNNKFYGTMGCNGTVNLKFTTPVYIWLLENM